MTPIDILIAFIVIFWVVRTAKATAFWLYVWQTKEYRIERFIDYFRTAQGRRALVNRLFVEKAFLLFAALGIPVLQQVRPNTFETQQFVDNVVFTLLFVVFVGTLALYTLEAAKTAVDLKRHRLLFPAFTSKMKVLSALLLGVAILFVVNIFLLEFHPIVRLDNPLTFLIMYDIVVPIIVSAVVLGMQPVTVFLRNRTLARAKTKREKFANLKVIGITGSYGKTSTKEFLAHILAAKFNVLKTPEHQNSEFGVANAILNKLDSSHEVFVCEMGAYKKGEIKALAEVAQPHIGIVTGVNEQHLATFGSMENLLSAEGGKELVELLPENGAVFVNESVIRQLADKVKSYNAKCKILHYGKTEDVEVQKDRVTFNIEGVRFEVPVYGSHSVENLAGAIAVARELGMTMEDIAKAAATMPLEASSFKVCKNAQGTMIIDSTYSANPTGVLADLGYLSLYEGRKVLVMPSLIELGPAAQEAHWKIGQKIAEVCDWAIITTKEHFEDIKKGAGGSDKVVYMDNAHEIAEKIKGAGAVLLEGGKDSRLQRILIDALM